MQTSHWPARLYLVRHGQSQGNVARDRSEAEGLATIGIDMRDVDVPLSDLGHQQAQAAGTPAKPPRHVGGRRGLVEEHQTFRVECGLAPDEGVAGLGHVRTLLLGGVQTFFLRVML